jgi:sporulation protein YlmC with PRC-barrel domain
MSGQFMSQQQQGQWLASKLIGTTVVGANNESIGDVNDVLMEKDGKAVAVVVGVGGFLGIGEKDVAVPFQSLEFTSRQAMSGSAGSAGGTGTTGTSGPATTATAPAGSASSDRPATTASTNRDGMPDRIMLRMTKQDLQNAPKFVKAGDNESSSSGSARPAGSGSGTGTGTAPRQ